MPDVITKIGARAAAESSSVIKRALRDAELVFITTGLGGGTGTGAAPVIGNMAKEMGALVVAVLTTPFGCEGSRRLTQAMAGVAQLTALCLDNLIVIRNDRPLEFVDRDAQPVVAFRTSDEVVTQRILSISELINVPGAINVNFADIKGHHEEPRRGSDGHRRRTWEHGSARVRPAGDSPSTSSDLSIKGAAGVLFPVKAGSSLYLGGVNAAGELISKTVKKDATHRLRYGHR